jgi:hypothetical protein
MDMDPWGDGPALSDDQAAWRERERRQRSVRFLMMFLLMLLLMDGEEQTARRRSHDSNSLRKRSRASKQQYMEPLLYQARRDQDEQIHLLTTTHPRYQQLLTKNNGENIDEQVRKWAEQQLDLEKDEFSQIGEETVDPEEERKVMHYPWNVTGFYRGEWAREGMEGTDSKESSTTTKETTKVDAKPSSQIKNAVEIESDMLQILKERKETVGVYLLPEGMEVKIANYTNTEEEYDQKQRDNPAISFLRIGNPGLVQDTANPQITLTKTSGRAAFQLYSRSVPAIKEISIVDGFVKLYDSNTVGYSTRRDILLRVSGVLVHSVGRISLVSNAPPGRSALVIEGSSVSDKARRRRLQEAVSSVASPGILEQIRDDVLALFPLDSMDEEDFFGGDGWTLTSVDLEQKDEENIGSVAEVLTELLSESRDLEKLPRRRLTSLVEKDGILLAEKSENAETDQVPSGRKTSEKGTVKNASTEESLPISSKYVVPYPFVPDDSDSSIRKTKTPAARRMPPREQVLEANAGSCEFEVNMDAQEVEWTIGEWRALVGRHVKADIQLDPRLHRHEGGENGDKDDRGGPTMSSTTKPFKSSRPKVIQDQALVMTMNGTIYSPNCDFKAILNATAIRTDWEHTTGKAINYSFYMMLTCLTQIVVLLRQLLHTQVQSAATKVSLLCIGWQTVLDALLCMVHIYLSLSMQPLFTAFASVAFFKLLIFCVIEMKYMAIIIQARNANNGGNTIELLRRQIAMLHLRFYVALIGSFLAFFYAGDTYRTIYLLALYSFWVPQIVQNVITEAKRPLHLYYIYGMSLTRLFAPLYMFAVPNNFLKEVYPDSPTNIFMCELLFVWVGIQTAVLVGQGRYGARFMIPARFLPPKFDYSRPIPSSLLPPGGLELSPSESLQNERASTEVQALVTRENSPHRTVGGARNRIKGSRVNRAESTMTAETVNPAAPDPSLPTIDCVICYNSIDLRNRRGYMLAPCDHLFHKTCLVQWMEVKMECPICRTELPAL